MIISGIVKSSLVDYPGMVAGVLFVPGCNYNCFYCHNRSLLDGTHDIIDPHETEEFLKKRKGLLDGIVITGGEPTSQKGLISYIKKVKSYGYKVKLDTNGSSPLLIAQILNNGLCDYFAVDYKAPKARYKEICGDKANADSVLKTIEFLIDEKADFEVRTTVIPQLSEEDIVTIAEELPVVPRYVLNKYKAPEKFLPKDRERISAMPYTRSQLDSFKIKIRDLQPNIVR